MGSFGRYTGGEVEYLREMDAEERKVQEILEGLKPCKVCGGEAKIVTFGLGGMGVWIGCDRTARCSRNIELHTEGWSIEEVARDWNRRNGGMRGTIRGIKMWIEDRFGAGRRYERRIKREKEREDRDKMEKRREIFGVTEKKRGIFGRKFWRKGKK